MGLLYVGVVTKHYRSPFFYLCNVIRSVLTQILGLSLKYERTKCNLPEIFLVDTKAPVRPLTSAAIKEIIEKTCLSAGIDLGSRPHGTRLTRHSAGSILHRENVPQSVIATILGHSNMATTSIYISTDEEKLYPEYLCMFFNRTEFDRYARFHSWGSARETFTWNDLTAVKIPIPDINVQKAIAQMYSVYVTRKQINEQLKAQIKNICPVLIKGSLKEGKRSQSRK